MAAGLPLIPAKSGCQDEVCDDQGPAFLMQIK
jgi:hypothetical protein